MFKFFRQLFNRRIPEPTESSVLDATNKSPPDALSDSLEFEEALARELEPFINGACMPPPGQDGAARLELSSGGQAAAALRYGGLLGKGQSAESFLLLSDLPIGTPQPRRLLLGITEGNYKAPVSGLAGVIALSTLAQHICGSKRSSDLESDLRQGFTAASLRLSEVAKLNPPPRLSRWKFSSFMGMQPERFLCPMSSVTALAVCGSTAVLGHIGEGRAYLLRRGQLTRLSADHTLAAQLGVSSETIAMHGDIPIKILGGTDPGEKLGEVEFNVLELEPLDTLFLLSANGFAADTSGQAAALCVTNSPEVACEQLLARAEPRQRFDRSVTAVVLRVGSRLD